MAIEMFSAVAAAASTADPLIHVPSVTGKDGEEVSLAVTLKNNPGVAAYTLSLGSRSTRNPRVCKIIVLAFDILA